MAYKRVNWQNEKGAAAVARRKIDDYWRDRVRQLTEAEPRLSSIKICDRLKTEAAESDPPRNDWPSEKTIRNIMAEHRAAPPEVRREYSLVKWPESFGTRDLPWASAS